MTRAKDKINSLGKGVISLISLGKHFSVLELQAEETGRRGEHGRVPEEMVGHREWMSQLASEGVEWGMGKRQERKQWGLWTPSLPHLCTHSGAAGVHEQPLVSGHGDYVPQAAKLLPETGLTLGKTLTHQGWRGDESRRITAVDEPCKVSAFWSSVWKGWEGNEKSLLEKKQCKGSRWHWLSCCKNPQRSFYTICVGYFSYPVDTEEKRVIIYVSIYFCTSGH